MKNIIQALKVITLALILSFGISYVYAWTAPTVTPPNGNVSAPINTSATSQYKEGALGIGGLIRGYANAIFDGSVRISTTELDLPLVVYSSSANGSAMALDRPAGLAGMYQIRTSGSPRWVFGGDASLESGSNAGTDFQIISYNDAGLGLANPVTIERSTGNVGIGTPGPTQKLDVAGNVKGTGLCIGTDCRTSWPTGGGATPPAGSEFLDTSATAQTKAGDLKVSGSIGIGLGASNPAQKLDVAGSAQITGTIFGGGAQTTYGATTIRGDKNSWSGINFAAASGVNNGTLMMHPSYSGFYNAADNNWRMYVSDAGNVSANDYFSNASGKWASSAQTRVTGSCAVGQAITAINADGTVTCGAAGGSSGLGVGQTWQNVTASRACGVGYTNSTGKPIMANIYVGNTAAQQFPFFNAYVDGVLVGTFNLRSWGANGGLNFGSSVNFVVPNGSSYNCAMSGDAAVYSWTELR